MDSSAPAEGGRPSLVMGFGAGLLVIGLTAALVTIDYNNQIRSANDQLDVASQSLMETIHKDLLDVERVFRSLETNSDDLRFQDRLAPLLSFEVVHAVGHQEGNDEAIEWSLDGSAIPPVGLDSIEGIDAGSAHEVSYLVSGRDLLIVYPHVGEGPQVWDMALVDVGDLVESSIPELLQQAIIWDFEPVPAGSALEVPDSDVHREYLILGPSATWQFESQWTHAALADIGVGVNWTGAAAGLLVAMFTGLLASRWVRRRYLEAGLRATYELLDQKDLLLLAVSHQLRTPLTGTIGFLRLALDDESEGSMSSEEKRELAKIALEQAERASEIVEDLLLAARVGDEQLVTVNVPLEIEPLVVATFEATRRRAGESLEDDDSAELTRVEADPVRARQLFRNVFASGREVGAESWAMKIEEGGGAVEVILRPDVKIDPKLRRLRAESVATPAGISAIRSSIEVARRLAEFMGGDLTLSQSDGATEIRVTFRAEATERLDDAESTSQSPGNARP